MNSTCMQTVNTFSAAQDAIVGQIACRGTAKGIRRDHGSSEQHAQT